MCHSTLEQAIVYVSGGFSIFPVRADGSKRPAIDSWKPFRQRPPSQEQLHAWYDNRRDEFGIALVCGARGLWALDIDDYAVADPYCRTLETVWPGCWTHLSVIETPRPGRQILCRLSGEVPGNEKYAYQRGVEGSVKASIESRGDGGYVISVGSPAATHPSGRRYRHAYGCATQQLQPIATSQFEKIRTVARLFNEVEIQTTDFVAQAYEGEPRPGDVYNAHVAWQPLLTGAGWTLDRKQGGVELWRRPGKTDGHSAQLGFFRDDAGRPLLGVFSTSLAYGPKDGQDVRVLTPFDFLTHAFFAGNYSQAALHAREQYSHQLAAAQAKYWDEQDGTEAKDFRLESIPSAQVIAKNVGWLWPEFLPLSMLTIYSGEQGLGKSFMTMDLVARTTRGDQWPDGSANTVGPGSALLLVAEDDPDKVVVPRLQAAGANLDLVDIIRPVMRKRGSEELRLFSVTRDIHRLQRKIEELQRSGRPPCQLLVVDPLSAFLTKTDPNDFSDTRICTTLLAHLCEQYGLAMLVVHHFGKDTQRAALHRSLGSTSFTAAARVVLGGFTDRNDRDRKILARIKSNISRDKVAIGYRLAGRSGPLSQNIGIIWEGQTYEFNEDEVREKGTREERRDYLKQWLESLPYPTPATDVYAQAKKLGYSEKMVRETARQLGIVPKCPGFGQPWQLERAVSEVNLKTSDTESRPVSEPIPYTQKTSDTSDTGETTDVANADLNNRKENTLTVSEESEVLCVQGKTSDTGESPVSDEAQETSDTGRPFVLGEALGGDLEDEEWLEL